MQPEIEQQGPYPRSVGHGIDPVQVGSQRCHAGLGDRGLIHACRVVVAHQPGRASGRPRLGGRRLEKLVHQLVVVLGQHTEGAPRAVCGRHRVCVEPAAVHMPEEVVPGRDVVIDERRVDVAGPVGHRSPRWSNMRRAGCLPVPGSVPDPRAVWPARRTAGAPSVQTRRTSVRTCPTLRTRPG